MKKLIFGLIATVLFGNLSYGQEEIKLSDYGEYHNKCLELYYSANDKVDLESSEKIINEITTLIQKKYPNQFKVIAFDELVDEFKKITPRKFEIKTFWDSNKNDLYKKDIVSSKLGNLIDDILIKGMEYEEIIAVMNEFKKSEKLTELEHKNIQIFESVLNSSNNYWNTSQYLKGGKPGSKAIIADALGALMFCYAAPASIIMGGICSLYVNESQ